MKKVVSLLLLISGSAFGQRLWGGPFHVLPDIDQIISGILTSNGGSGGGSNPFGTPSTVVNNNTTASATTVTKTTTAGDMLYLYGTSSPSSSCATYNGGSGVQFPTNTGGETMVAIPMNGAVISGIQVTSVGSGYGAAPTCTVNGAGTAQCVANLSGSTVGNVTISNQGSLSSATPASITLTPVSGGSGAVAVISNYCIADSAGGTHSAWYAANIPGHASEVFTLDTNMSGYAYNTLGVIEISGANASTPFDTAVQATGGSGGITAPSFNTAGQDAVFCSGRVESDPSGWTADTAHGYALVSGAPNGGANQSFTSVEFNTYNGAQTGLTPSFTPSAAAQTSLICAAFKH